MQLSPLEEKYGIKDVKVNAGNRFLQLIKQAELKAGKKVVIIIDEYDAPLLDVLHDKDRLEAVRTVMQELYAPIKASDKYIKFAFITGITKFSRFFTRVVILPSRATTH